MDRSLESRSEREASRGLCRFKLGGKGAVRQSGTVFIYIVYYLDTICQVANKACGYKRLERKKFSLKVGFARGF